MKNVIVGDDGHIELLHNALRSLPGSGITLKNVYITVNEKHYRKVDLLYIGFGGVLLFSILSGQGSYNTPSVPNDWQLNKFGEDELNSLISYENPYTTLGEYRAVFSALLEHEEINAVGTIRECVLCATPHASFSEAHRDLLYSDQIAGYVKNFNSKRLFSPREIKSADEIIAAFDEYNRDKKERLDKMAKVERASRMIKARRSLYE